MQKSSFKDIIRNDSITNNTKVVVPLNLLDATYLSLGYYTDFKHVTTL